MPFVEDNDQVQYLFHHLFLPPKLPGGDDTSASKTIFLMEFVLKSLQSFADKLVGEDEAAVHPAILMLKNMRHSTDPKGFLNYLGVKKVLATLSLDSLFQPYPFSVSHC